VGIVEDHLGQLWVATDDGLNKFDSATQTFTIYRNRPDDPLSLPINSVGAIMEDSAGTLWVGTGSGLRQFDRQTETFVPPQAEAVDQFNQDGIWALLEAKNGVLWIGGTNALYSLNPATGAAKVYPPSETAPNHLNDGVIFTLHEDETGVIWAGTFVGGLNKLDPQCDTFTHYTEMEGLANNTVGSILQDNAGFLWVSTGKGLSKFDPRTETFKNYYASDGLQENILNIRAHYQG
jgi:ligand-binding sensor domain-containing protein